MLQRLHLIGTSALIFLAAVACEKPMSDPTSPNHNPPIKTGIGPDGSAAAQFAAVQHPTQDTAQVYGTYTRGCVAGAEQVAVSGPHWQVLNPARNRAWGHPVLVRFVKDLAVKVANDGHVGLLVGDLAQPRGGPLPSDHNSHQVGLDADIWLTPMPTKRLSLDELETFNPPSMVDITTMTTNRSFGVAQYSMLKHAAQSNDVERIFVSPPIKRALCDRAGNRNSDWLRKIRPWRGHMAHMHVRLSCPPGSDDCKDQDPPPEGDGCGAELSSWLKDRTWASESKGIYVPEKAIKVDGLPPECKRILESNG